MKRLALVAVGVFMAAGLLTSCSRPIPSDQYIKAMVALGCKGAGVLETTPEGAAVLKEAGVTLDQVKTFRKESKPPVMVRVSMEIARSVAQCHGVNMPQPPQQP